ncbi:MAG: phospholipase D-like domain-containing protein [Bacteroidales bacterium]|nr:phospholipase D-like domain-containing protein [Bacteroidales bacterium]
MANTGVNGKVIFTGTSNGISDLKIQIVDFDGIPDEQTLGWTTTDSNGNFSVTYPKNSYGSVEWEPDIVVRVYDPYLRVLHETVEVKDVSDTTLVIPNISLHPKNVSGWLVTNATINPSGTPVDLSAGNEITFLIDNEDAWREITDVAAGATSSINFQLLYWEVPGVITKFNTMPVVGKPVTGEQLQVKFKDKAAAGIPVKIIMNDFTPDVFGNLDTANEVTKYYQGTSVNLRLYETFPQSPFHGKLMIVDGHTAYLIGSPIMNEYFDSKSHLIDEPRRGPFSIANAIKAPIHEVNTKVKGPVVNAIDSSFCLYWNRLRPFPSTPDLNPAPVQNALTGSNIASVQVTRTTPGNIYVTDPSGETGILESYQRAIANANDFIYIEDQYFTSYELVEALIKRMKKTSVQVILLLNIKIDIPGYHALQIRVINRLLSEAAKIQAQNRLGIFTLWSHEPHLGVSRIARNYIHSKTAIIDDKWATVGSANTDGASLNQTQIYGSTTRLPLWRPTQHANPNMAIQPLRATELNLAIYNGVEGQPATTVISDLRKRLWQEHLGFNSPAHTGLSTKPANGWIDLWNGKANEKRNGLRKQTIEVKKPRILKWKIVKSNHDSTYRFLSDNVGYKDSRMKVWTNVRGFDFSTGKWQ